MATVTNRYLTALGPIKMEVLFLSAASGADTVTTYMQRPVAGGGWQTEAADTSALTCSVSGKTITLNSATLSNDTALVIVFGF